MAAAQRKETLDAMRFQLHGNQMTTMELLYHLSA
jgi:hypothetical protein